MTSEKFKEIIIYIILIPIAWFLYNLLFVPSKPAFDPLNATYVIENTSYALTDGKSEKPVAPGSATKIQTAILGKPAVGDLNADGLDDAALLLVHEPGGSGTFFYVVAALQDPENNKAVGTNAVLLGDRVSPKNISVYKEKVELNYLDRYPWEPYSQNPSVAKTKVLTIENNELREIDRPVFSQENAQELVELEWGSCLLNDCDQLQVSVLDGKDGVWYVEAVYDGLKDDSVRASKKTARVHYEDSGWELGAVVLEEHMCQPNRGHQDFSSELCI